MTGLQIGRGSGTAAAAALVTTVLALAQPPTVADIKAKLLVGSHDRPHSEPSTFGPNVEFGLSAGSVSTNLSTWQAESKYFIQPVDRQTSAAEIAVGELRRMASLPHDWDGEGACAPHGKSLRAATNFIRMVPSHLTDAETMLNANGHAGLSWDDPERYAELEFLGDGRIAYFIQHGEDRHKGIVHFDDEVVPPALLSLLEVSSASSIS